MKDSKGSHPIYIAIDARKIARCKWCGTAESGEWGKSKTGLYCSGNCEKAVQVDQNICGLVLGAITFTAFLATPSTLMSPEILFLFIALFIPISCCLLEDIRIGRRVQREIPRGSRRNEVSSAALLKALPSIVACPRCDANIDLRKVREDRVYACEYCGATGTIEIVMGQKT